VAGGRQQRAGERGTGSVVGAPCASIAQPAGIGRPSRSARGSCRARRCSWQVDHEGRSVGPRCRKGDRVVAIAGRVAPSGDITGWDLRQERDLAYSATFKEMRAERAEMSALRIGWARTAVPGERTQRMRDDARPTICEAEIGIDRQDRTLPRVLDVRRWVQPPRVS